MTDPTARFRALVNGPEDALPLDEAALLLAAHASPGLDVATQLRRLDDLAAQCPEPTLGALCGLLFEEMGFAGASDDYSDPRNSFLDQVLDRRTGIPISLSVVMLEVGRRVGVPLEGVGMPGHFLVRHTAAPRVLIDPFNGGRHLDATQCADLVASIFGPGAPFPASVLAPSGPRTILARMLANLKNSYFERRDGDSLIWVSRLRTAIPGVSPRELADLAKVLVELGRFGEAADALEGLAGPVGQPAGPVGQSAVPDDEAQARFRVQAIGLRARLN